MIADPLADLRRGGQPLWALGGLLLCWIAVRVVLYDVPAGEPALPESLRTIAGLDRSLDPRSPHPGAKVAPQAAVGRAGLSRNADLPPYPAVYAEPVMPVTPRPLPPSLPLPPVSPLQATHRAAGHNLLWMAAMRAVPLLPDVAAALAGDRTVPDRLTPLGQSVRARPARWSGDAWLAWRAGAQDFAASGPVTPVYGGSQAGALLRYEFAPAGERRSAAYLRAVRALGTAEGDLAAGLALRPIAGLPLTAHGEARLTRRGRIIELRPAAFVSGGIDAAPLAAGITARGYGQAGYVGGRDATAFADGSLVAEKPLWREREVTMTAGAGVWGGAQRGSARLDLGPTASLRFRLGEGTARVSADYRVRIAGNAEPAAGAALTLSAGF